MAERENSARTVLDPLRPSVVRRRVVNATAFDPRPTSFEEAPESAPPSSIDVTRALSDLQRDELRRVDELVRLDDDAEMEAARSAPERPVLALGQKIALSELADRMGASIEELPEALVTRGFFAVDAKAVLDRRTARTIAELYGWHVEELPGEPEERPLVKRTTVRLRSEAKRKSSPRPKPKPKLQAKRKTVVKVKRRRA